MATMKQWVMVSLFIWSLALGTSSQVSGQVSSSELAEAQRLSERFVELFNAGRYDEAVPLAERALAIREKTLGANHPDVAISLNNLAQLYHKKGDYVRSESLQQRALMIREKAFGAEHPTVAASLNNLASLYHGKGEYLRAEPLYKRAFEIWEKVLGPEHPDVATALTNLALLYDNKGDYERAEPLYQRALAIWEKALGSEHPGVANSLNNLAGLYREKGDYARAEPLHQRALAICENVFGPEHPEVAFSLNHLALLYSAQGVYTLAEPLYRRALAIFENALGGDHPAVAGALNNLASLYLDKGEYARAEPLYQRALAIHEKVFGADHPDVATSLNSLASLYVNKGDYVRAEPLYQRALAIREKALGAEHPNVAISLNNLAEIYLAQGDYVRAEPLHQRALSIRVKALGAEHPGVATSLNNLGSVYLAKGDYGRAETLFLRAQTISEKGLGGKHPNVAVSLNNLAALYETKGDFVRAVKFWQRGEEVREHNLSLILSTGSERQKQLYLNTIIDETSATTSLHARSAPRDPQAAQLALTTILRRKGRALGAMTDQISALRHRAASEDRQLLDQLATAQSQLAKLRFAEGSGPKDSSGPDQRVVQDERFTANIENLQARISSRSAEFRVQTQPVTIEAVQQALPANAALIELFAYHPFNVKAKTAAVRFGAQHYVGYVVKRTGAITFVDLGPTERIDRAADQFVNAIKNPATVNVKETGSALDEMVARPIRKLLGDTRHLLISPDGKLNLVPFAALVDEQGKYLVENYTVSYLTSGRDLLRLNPPGQSKQPPVVIANPDFNLASISTSALPATVIAAANTLPTSQTRSAPSGASGKRSGNMLTTNWNELPGTAKEAVDLQELLPNARVLTGQNATEVTLKQVVSPRILHLATHGFFLQNQRLDPHNKVITENPLLRSGLVLAGANSLQGGADEDGVLTALEAAGLNLWGTQLVVLSACQTGVGDVRSGEGVYGLRRALVLAGAESQMMTLWKVDDTATSETIVEYYHRLQAGEGRSEALRQVQLEFLKRKTRQHPFYWASFILNGDWRSMREKG